MGGGDFVQALVGSEVHETRLSVLERSYRALVVVRPGRASDDQGVRLALGRLWAEQRLVFSFSFSGYLL